GEALVLVAVDDVEGVGKDIEAKVPAADGSAFRSACWVGAAHDRTTAATATAMQASRDDFPRGNACRCLRVVIQAYMRGQPTDPTMCRPDQALSGRPSLDHAAAVTPGLRSPPA